MPKKHFGEEITKIVLCWAFDCFNDNKEVNIITFETMHYILCHNNLILNLNPKTQARKWLTIYNTINGIAALKKHVNSNHSNVLKKLKRWIVLWAKKKNNLPKRYKIFFKTPYLVFFYAIKPFKKEDVQQK